MSCGCVYSSYDGEPAAFYCIEQPIARKPHKCCECGETIQVGQRYERTSGAFDGTMQRYKTCLDCVEIRDLLCCEGFNYTAVWEDIREYFHGGGGIMGCLEKLESVSAKEKLSNEYREIHGLDDARPSSAGDKEDTMSASNTFDCFRDCIGKRVVAVLQNAIPWHRRDIAQGTKTLVFDDGSALTITSNGSFWIDRGDDVKRAVKARRDELTRTTADLEELNAADGLIPTPKPPQRKTRRQG